mmetsp:Transcript_58049/g.65808  ORF Transcript_58049/g.65808 Transcript_58049/m.65808 type:complete len:349 (+) Transcript_58049:107-1153(+)
MTAAVTERTPMVGGSTSSRTTSTSESHHQSHTDDERPISKMTQYRKVSMLVACSLFVVSAALQLGLVTMGDDVWLRRKDDSPDHSQKSLVTQSSKGEPNVVPSFSLVQEEDVDVVDSQQGAAEAAAAVVADADLVTMSFDTYQRNYGKVHAWLEEMEQRAQIYDDTVQKINDHNTQSPMRKKKDKKDGLSNMSTDGTDTDMTGSVTTSSCQIPSKCVKKGYTHRDHLECFRSCYEGAENWGGYCWVSPPGYLDRACALREELMCIDLCDDIKDKFENLPGEVRPNWFQYRKPDNCPWYCGTACAIYSSPGLICDLWCNDEERIYQDCSFNRKCYAKIDSCDGYYYPVY